METVAEGILVALARDLVPAEQAATVAGVSLPTLWRAARAGRIAAHRTGPKETRFSMAEARRWGAERTRSRGRRAA
jgi:excisionase family DNA binding protein